MANPEKSSQEWLEKQHEEYKERKRKEREAFRKLSSQEKIERLMKYIDELEQKVEDHENSDVVCQAELEENMGEIDRRFRVLYNLLRRSEARDDQLEELVSLRSFGPVDTECPECHRRTVIRKRSNLYSADYILECISCHWAKEFKR